MNKEQLPEYRSHKVVKAGKIGKIYFNYQNPESRNPLFTGATLVLEKDGIQLCSVVVDRNYMETKRPIVGGYYVLYNNNYESWCPEAAFEQGYSLL